MLYPSANRGQWETGGKKLKPIKSKLPLDSHKKPMRQSAEVLSVICRGQLNVSVSGNSCYSPMLQFPWTVESETCFQTSFLTLLVLALSKLLQICELQPREAYTGLAFYSLIHPKHSE